MGIRFRSVSVALFAIALLGAAGCSLAYTKDVAPVANGEGNVLLFKGADPTKALAGVAPLGTTRTVLVTRDAGGTKECSVGQRSLGSGGIHPMGGGGLDDPEHCEPTNETEVDYAVESAACDEGACVVTTDPARSQLFHVGATAAQISAGAPVEARLRVTLKSLKDGSLYSDTFVLRFARAARIEVRNGIHSPLPLVTPMMPGVELVMPTATVLSAEDDALVLEPDALVMTFPAAIFASKSSDPYDPSWVAKAPGHATLTWELPGVIARSLDLEVVDPTRVRSLAVLGPEDERKRRYVAQTLDEALAIPEAPAVEKLAATAHRHIVGELRVVLEDGRTALVNVDRVETDHPAEAKSGVEEGAFRIYRLGATAVTGTVTVHAAGLSRSLPFSLTP